MLRLLYDFALLLYTIINLPKFAWEAIQYRKHRKSFLEKLGFNLPVFKLPSDGSRIWVHSISMGETKAVAPLVQQIRQEMPNASIVISTTTETGLAEAKRSMPELDHYFYLPFDFSWTIRRLTNRIKPDLLILVESDFWYNLVSYNKKVVLVNGKISETSQSRFKLFSFFTKKLFSEFDLFCLQSQRFASRFETLGVSPSKIVVTGNLKFDQPFPHLDIDRWRSDLGIRSSDKVITLGSTHDPEEEQLLTTIEPLFDQFQNLKILLVPRHPERFSAVAALLDKKKIHYAKFSDHSPKQGNERILLIDAMGVLSACYRLSDIAIVGGSYVSHVGGHNIFEPAALGIPVLFGPHMETQKDLVDIVVHGGAGKQVPLSSLASTLEHMLKTPPLEMKKAGLKLAEEVHGATDRTWKSLQTIF
ncbi:MAG TPA: 3-deoxy-D-manno-octulosonic acid transferase [Rhabdochlamydiaceae bacterium]|jgi:3-deoxy-D-manno-octulosonic-acid transferase|nr:3-deoxy-D-manno-octulosonic acid transferase [Rhabdochlamydiaceae bacterium]